MSKTKRLTLCAILIALALALSYTERFIPLQMVIPLPGVKLGLANIVTVFAVFMLGPVEAVLILTCRIFLGAVFAGNFSSIFYSAAGGAVSILVCIGLAKLLTGKQIWVAGCLGAVSHSVGQMIMAILLTGTPGLAVYLPVMVVCSIFSGTFTGLCAQFLVNRGEKLWKTSFK